MDATIARTAKPGDVVVVHGHYAGAVPRSGVILEVLGEEGHEHFRVRWDEEHVSLFWPSSDATIHPRKPAAPVLDADPDPEC
jgi:hypothetical protein